MILSAAKLHGFTLIEILIVVSVMGILMAASIPTFNSYTKNQVLVQAVRNIRTDVRTVENFALSGAGGQAWGLHFYQNSGQYVIFLCTPSSDPTTYLYGNPACSLSRTQTLSAQVKINNSSDLDLAFDAVSGTIYANGVAPTTVTQISVSYLDGSSPKLVCVSQTGGVREELNNSSCT